MQTRYAPIVTDIRMSDYGYWIVTISVSPGRYLDCTIALIGITPEEAERHALATLMGIPD